MMNAFSLTHIADHLVARGLAAAVLRESGATAEVLAWIAEFDARKLYLPAAYPSMYDYCLGELQMSEDRACKHIRAARAAREFPAIFELVARNRLSLSAVLLLAPHLQPETASDLLEAASDKRRAEIERLLAERFPRQDVQTSLREVPATRTAGADRQGGPAAAPEPSESESSVASAHSSAPGRVVPSVAPTHDEPMVPLPTPSAVASVRPHSRLAPLSPGRYELRTTLDQATHDKLRRVQELLSHSVPSGDVAEVLGRALDLALAALEKRRFATTSRPSARRRSQSTRHVPAHVRREVSDRDRYQCTFVSASGKRCAERRFLEYDHVHPVARGGQPTVENTRLRCRAHNQYEAERIYGAGFMREKRAMARARPGAANTRSVTRGASHAAGA